MQIKITNPNVKISSSLRLHILQRLGLALGRFADRIRLVTVIFAAAKAAVDPPLTRCRIELDLHKKVSVEAANSDLFAAVDLAADHAARAIARVLEDEATRKGHNPSGLNA